MTDLAARLNRTPLAPSDAGAEVAEFKRALSREIELTLDTSSPREVVASAQNAICQLYQGAIDRAPATKRAELSAKLNGVRDLHNLILTLHEPAPTPTADAPLQDPLAGASIVPPM